MKGRFICELRTALVGLRDIFFARNCAVCGGFLGSDEHLVCRRCLGDIPLTYFWNYSENGAMERLFGGGGETGDAGHLADCCRVHNAAALFFYRHDSPYCEIVRKFKYGRWRELGLWAARLLGSYLAGGCAGKDSDDSGREGSDSGCAGGGLYGDVQGVVPVPLHPLKRWKRGFNQAEIIARGVAESLGGLPVAGHLLRRRRYTSTQTRRGARSRQQNVSGAFALNTREATRLQAAGVKHILLVDDVMTTGATLRECIRLLQNHFTVSVATLGFVE